MTRAPLWRRACAIALSSITILAGCASTPLLARGDDEALGRHDRMIAEILAYAKGDYGDTKSGYDRFRQNMLRLGVTGPDIDGLLLDDPKVVAAWHAYVERGLATEADVAKAKTLAPALASSVQEWRLHDGPGANDLEQAMYVTIVLAAFASSAQQQQQQSKPTTAGRNAGVVGHQPAPSHGNAGGSAGRRGGGSRPPAGGKVGVTTGNNAAAQRQACLNQCKAQPITPMRTAQTNSFLAHQQRFEDLLEHAQVKCAASASFAEWKSCMGSLVMGALWSVEDAADNDHKELFRRWNASFQYFHGNTCLNASVRGTRSDCLLAAGSVDAVRNLCIARLKADVEQMRCDYQMLAQVWQAEDARNDADAAKRRDADCDSRCR